MKTVRVWAGLLAACAVVSSAARAAVDFDQGADASGLLRQAREIAARDKSVVAPSFVRYDRDCVSFAFGPDDPLASPQVQLRSTEWIVTCYPDPPSPPPPAPRRKDSIDQKYCTQRPGMTYRKWVRLTLRGRGPLYPWEREKFEACLEGPYLSLQERAAAYEYKRVGGGMLDGDYVLAAGGKIPMAPDPAGIYLGGWTSGMVVGLKDRWASYYAGETAELTFVLRKFKPHWFDPKILEKTISMPVAETYTVGLLDFAAEFSQELEPGAKYYVEYYFKRAGSVSKPERVKGGATEPAVYRPALLTKR